MLEKCQLPLYKMMRVRCVSGKAFIVLVYLNFFQYFHVSRTITRFIRTVKIQPFGPFPRTLWCRRGKKRNPMFDLRCKIIKTDGLKNSTSLLVLPFAVAQTSTDPMLHYCVESRIGARVREEFHSSRGSIKINS